MVPRNQYGFKNNRLLHFPGNPDRIRLGFMSLKRDISLDDHFRDPSYSEATLQYRHSHRIVWVIWVVLIGRASDSTNGKIVCLTGRDHSPTENMNNPHLFSNASQDMTTHAHLARFGMLRNISPRACPIGTLTPTLLRGYGTEIRQMWIRLLRGCR